MVTRRWHLCTGVGELAIRWLVKWRPLQVSGDKGTGEEEWRGGEGGAVLRGCAFGLCDGGDSVVLLGVPVRRDPHASALACSPATYIPREGTFSRSSSASSEGVDNSDTLKLQQELLLSYEIVARARRGRGRDTRSHEHYGGAHERGGAADVGVGGVAMVGRLALEGPVTISFWLRTNACGDGRRDGSQERGSGGGGCCGLGGKGFVVLRRDLDYSVADQCARVFVAGRFAGLWVV